MPTAAPSDGAVARLVEITKFYDREEAVAAAAALDSAGIVVVLNGMSLLDAYPELRGVSGYPLYGLEHELGDARALLSWRPEDWAPYNSTTRFFSAPILNTALMIVSTLGLPYMARGSRGAANDDGE